jgi:hypothetical protein
VGADGSIEVRGPYEERAAFPGTSDGE